MKISTRGRYALRFLIDLAEHDECGYITLKDITTRQNISIKYLEQITSLLNKNGLLESIRGPQGGYKLAKPATEYLIGDILRITEGDLAPVTCLEDEKNGCGNKNCPTLKLWKGLEEVISNYLDAYTLDDLIKHENNQ